MKRFISTFILSLSIWIALAGFNISELIVGIAISIIISILVKNIFKFELGWDFPVKIIMFIFIYIPIFLYELVKANIDVAYRVLSPKLPINPGFVKIPTDIKGELGKLTLANSITLTPGTISVDVDEQDLYIHWINIKGDNGSEYQKNISGPFEKILRRIFI